MTATEDEVKDALVSAEEELRLAQEKLWALFARQRAGEEVSVKIESAGLIVDHWSIQVEALTAQDKNLTAKAAWMAAVLDTHEILTKGGEAAREQSAMDSDGWLGEHSSAMMTHYRLVKKSEAKANCLFEEHAELTTKMYNIWKKADAWHLAHPLPAVEPEEVLCAVLAEAEPEIKVPTISRVQWEDELEEDEEEQEDERELCDFCNEWKTGLIRTSDDGEVCPSCAAGILFRRKMVEAEIEVPDEDDHGEACLTYSAELEAEMAVPEAEAEAECTCTFSGEFDECVDYCEKCQLEMEGQEELGDDMWRHYVGDEDAEDIEPTGLTEVTDVAASLREHAASVQQEAATYLAEIERWFDENGDEI